MLIKRSKKREKQESKSKLQESLQHNAHDNISSGSRADTVEHFTTQTRTPLIQHQDQQAHKFLTDDFTHDYDDYEQSDHHKGTPRSERRRGDRRRGYRRVDDRNLISRAQEEYNAIRENAAQEGFEVGIHRAKHELNNLVDAINNMLNIQEEVLNNAVPDIAEIAVKVAEKIIHTEVSCDETLVLNIVKETLKQVEKAPTSITIYVNPVDYENVKTNIPSVFPGSKNVDMHVMVHNNVEWGSCIIETNCGIVDANFATQLSLITKAFESKV